MVKEYILQAIESWKRKRRTNWKSLPQAYDALIKDAEIRQQLAESLYDRENSGQLRGSIEDINFDFSRDSEEPPPKPIIHHPLIAYALAIPRVTSSELYFTIQNGNISIKVSANGIMIKNKLKDEIPLPCCKQSRAFLILLLRELADVELTEISLDSSKHIAFNLGTNHTTMAESLGLSRSGRKNKDNFIDHVVRIISASYGHASFGYLDDTSGKYEFEFSSTLNSSIIKAHKTIDEPLFEKYIKQLNSETIKALGSTYALDLYLIATDQHAANINKENKLLKWNELFLLNGSSLNSEEKYTEKMRKAFSNVRNYFPEMKLASGGIEFFAEKVSH